jgi:cysteine synthase A
MPDDVAEEKVKALLALGADVERVRPASIVDKKQVSFQTILPFPTSL